MQRPWEYGRNWEKACVLELREWTDEWQMRLGRGHELDQLLVFVLGAVGNLSRVLSRNDMTETILLKRSLQLPCGECFEGGIIAVME